uniref:Myosin phosphatase Rho-interacting protein-like n=1 Tax=Hippocampus comes TaxID=109280 RepID=A0A3Q2YLZ7_HIPCM
MSVTENPCRKFQANIFQKSKCQNCFQPRASHPLHDQDLGQAKPVYGGWLLLAPEGSDFDNPLHRTRKWQRRFFILYEHGLLRYALDEMPATLPQGTVDMNRCSDVTDGESRTAHENSLCVVTPEKELFLRAEWKEMINGWQEALSVYPRSNKLNPKKKRKVEPPAQQVRRWREARPLRRRRSSLRPRYGGATSAGRKVRVESAYFSPEKTKSEPSPKPAQNPPAPRQPAPSSSTSSSSAGAPGRACEAKARPLPPGTLARPGHAAPDPLNLKKGWMTKLDQDGTWKKHWFVLTARSLRFYKDSLAEEASEADGEIHLSTCCDVQEFPVQRNYGFRILCQGGACTLSAMTSGIRRNWIQAITKNARAAVAPDTLDRSEFQMDKTGEPAKERADAVDRSPSLSATASRRSSSSSSPVPTSAPPSPRVQTEDDASRPPNGVLPKSPARPSLLESPERGGMEVDRPAARRDVEGETFGVSSSAKEEIERRWLQVETTPLREEKRVPIGASSENSDADGLPAQRLAAPFHEELGQKQEVLEQLQRRNGLLQERLEDALGREQRARDGYVLQAACERGFAAMEETHRKVVEDLQRQHQREISNLTEERERLLAEETAATVAAIEAMKNAHKEELEKNRRSQLSGLDADIDQLGLQYREELQSIQRELEVLSEQYSQKCLENAHLAQALEAERQALGRCRRQNRELDAHNQELNGRLSAEIARMRSCLSGETALSAVTPGKDVYELEVLLRVKESEIQYLKQEIHSLKDELQAALRDKKYAADKHKDIYAELSIVKAKADCDVGKLKEKLHIATQALGDGTVSSGYDLMKSKSNPDFMKKEQTTTSEPSRSVRSKASFKHVFVSSG